MDVTIRRARPDDVPAITDFTEGIWSDRGGDYLPDVIESWVRTEDDGQRTLVAEFDGRAVGVLQAVMLSDYEAWCQGMRVDPSHRGKGIGTRLTHAAFDWARERGATVARNLVLSWNAMGLGLSRAAGFAPATEFRWAHPAPDRDAAPEATVTTEPAAAWSYWQRGDARTALGGLALDLNESWALADLTRETLATAAQDTRLLVVHDGGIRGMSYRVRAYERDTDEGPERWADYGVGAWEDASSAEALLAAISRDAAEMAVDSTRVLVPETVAVVSDVASAGVRFSDAPDFVMAADLTTWD